MSRRRVSRFQPRLTPPARGRWPSASRSSRTAWSSTNGGGSAAPTAVHCRAGAPRRRPALQGGPGRAMLARDPTKGGVMTGNRATLQRMLDAMFAGDFETTGQVLAEDAVVEWPQSGERMVG